jgi:hypothetical protein
VVSKRNSDKRQRTCVGNIPVTLFAEPPLQAEIIIKSSISASLILELPDCTTKTSFSRTLVKMRTLVSPLENCVNSALAALIPRFSQIWPVRTGHEVPAKMSVLRMVVDPSDGLKGGKREERS